MGRQNPESLLQCPRSLARHIRSLLCCTDSLLECLLFALCGRPPPLGCFQRAIDIFPRARVNEHRYRHTDQSPRAHNDLKSAMNALLPSALAIQRSPCQTQDCPVTVRMRAGATAVP